MHRIEARIFFFFSNRNQRRPIVRTSKAAANLLGCPHRIPMQTTHPSSHGNASYIRTCLPAGARAFGDLRFHDWRYRCWCYGAWSAGCLSRVRFEASSCFFSFLLFLFPHRKKSSWRQGCNFLNVIRRVKLGCSCIQPSRLVGRAGIVACACPSTGEEGVFDRFKSESLNSGLGLSGWRVQRLRVQSISESAKPPINS